MSLVDGFFWRLHSSICMQPQATCASRADDSRRHQGQFTVASFWSKPVAFLEPGEAEEEGQLMRRGKTDEEELSEGCKKGATVDWRCCMWID